MKQAAHNRRNHSLFQLRQASHPELFLIGQVPGFTPRYHPGWEHTPQTHEAGGSRWAEADTAAWAMLSSDSDGLPPPVQPRQSISEWEDVNNRLGGLEIRTGEIQNTLNTHVQDSTQWHQQQQQQMAQNERDAAATARTTGGLLAIHGVQSWTVGNEQAQGRTPTEVSSIFYFSHFNFCIIYL